MLIVNRRINFDYNIHYTWEAGIALTGSEVKSIRKNQVSIIDCYVALKYNEVFLLNWNIPKYEQAYKDDTYNPRRERKILLHKNEISKIGGLIKREGYTIIVSKCYTNKRGIIKLELALCTAKKKYDKRQYIKEKDERRESRIKFTD